MCPLPWEMVNVRASGRAATITGMPSVSNPVMSATLVTPYRERSGRMICQLSSGILARWVPGNRTIGLAPDSRVVSYILEYRGRDLPAQIAVDTCVIDKEVARHVLGISTLWISHLSILDRKCT